MYVYVVGWHPSVDSGANGGFEWRYGRTQALQELAVRVVWEATHGGPEHNLVFAKIRVPFDVNPERPREYDDRENEITEWLDENIELFELIEQDQYEAGVR